MTFLKRFISVATVLAIVSIMVIACVGSVNRGFTQVVDSSSLGSLGSPGGGGAQDYASVSVGRSRVSSTLLSHPVHIIARHPKSGCDDTAACGEVFADEVTHNLRTSLGSTWQSQLMGDTTTPTLNAQAFYMGLTNSAITPAFADSTLSGLITSNGLECAAGTYNNASGPVYPPTPQVGCGLSGSSTYYYWVMACQNVNYITGIGICTLPGSSGSVTNCQATSALSYNYPNTVTFPCTPGLAYRVLRTASASAPTGTGSFGVYDESRGSAVIGCPMQGGQSGQLNDYSSGLYSITIPTNAYLTNIGRYTLSYTWTATAAQSAQGFGIFVNSGGGTTCTAYMVFEGTFNQVNLNTNDTLQVTETVNF
jgi:hypothetical protein